MTATRIVLMGVAGSGKSTIGRLVAARLDAPFVDADDLHTPAAIAAMHAGHPLDDMQSRRMQQIGQRTRPGKRR